jgi:hypothetical protein
MIPAELPCARPGMPLVLLPCDPSAPLIVATEPDLSAVERAGAAPTGVATPVPSPAPAAAAAPEPPRRRRRPLALAFLGLGITAGISLGSLALGRSVTPVVSAAAATASTATPGMSVLPPAAAEEAPTKTFTEMRERPAAAPARPLRRPSALRARPAERGAAAKGKPPVQVRRGRSAAKLPEIFRSPGF